MLAFSLNLEAPTPERLARIADKKIFHTALMEPMRWVKMLADRGMVTSAGMTTQFVVGAADEIEVAVLVA